MSRVLTTSNGTPVSESNPMPVKIQGNGGSGEDGASAYEIAVEHGFEGTEEEWLDSLQGQQGDPGTDGDDGEQGPRGEQGPAGDNGSDGASVTGATSDGANITFELSDGNTIEVPWPNQED